MLYGAIISAVISFIVTVLLGKFLIPVLKSVKMGQKILDIGPRWHKGKEGTPTMGGLFFIGGFLASVLTVGVYIAIQYRELTVLIINVLFCLFSAFTGFIDDFVKFFKKQNKGLSPSQKLICQFATAAAYLAAMAINGRINTSFALPFTDFRLELGIYYYFFAILGIVFTVNSVNLTDGIDGLASSVTFIAGLFLAAVSFKVQNDTALVCSAAVVGGCMGFLVYNFYPAKVFMGDTGSLFLGGVVTSLAFWIDMPLLLVFVGIIYYVESISVMLQVTYYKMTGGKRIFKMTPIHHHFEMCGWNEVKIVFVFSEITVITSAVGSFGYLTV